MTPEATSTTVRYDPSRHGDDVHRSPGRCGTASATSPRATGRPSRRTSAGTDRPVLPGSPAASIWRPVGGGRVSLTTPPPTDAMDADRLDAGRRLADHSPDHRHDHRGGRLPDAGRVEPPARLRNRRRPRPPGGGGSSCPERRTEPRLGSWRRRSSASSARARWAPASPRSRSRPATRVLLNDVDEARDRTRTRPHPRRSRTTGREARPGRRHDRRLGQGRAAGLRDAHSLDALGAEADVVIEAALEDLACRQTIFRTLDGATGDREGVILATNTSALSVGAIAAATGRADRVVGLHFFNPARSWRWSRSSPTSKSDGTVVDRAASIVEIVGQGPGPLDRLAGLHRQPRQPPVHDRGPADGRARRGIGRGDRRGDARSRLSDGSVRAAWTSSGWT